MLKRFFAPFAPTISAVAKLPAKSAIAPRPNEADQALETARRLNQDAQALLARVKALVRPDASPIEESLPAPTEPNGQGLVTLLMAPRPVH